MSKLNELLPIAAQVRDATEEYENTANRIGSLFVAILEGIIESVPEAAIDANSIRSGLVAGEYLITMDRLNSDGSKTPIQITIPVVSEKEPGLVTPSILATISSGIKDALSVAQNAQSSADNTARSLNTTLGTLQTLNDNLNVLTRNFTSVSDSITEQRLTILNYNVWRNNSSKFELNTVIDDLINSGRIAAGMIVAFLSDAGWVYKRYTGGNDINEFRNLDNWKDFGGSAVGNIFNVSVEVPIAGYYTLCDEINPELSAVHAAWNKGKAVCGLILSFEISAGKWKTYQYVGKAKKITPEAWTHTDNWQDFGSLAAGSEKFIIIDNIIPCAGGYYTIESALNALLAYEEQSSIVYRKEGLVISYRTAERQFETKQFIGSLADFSDASLWKEFGGGGAVAEVEVTDTPKEGGSEAFSSGGAFAHLPTTIGVNAEQEGVVKLQLRNESGEAIGDEVQFLVGTGSGGGSATIVSIKFQDSALYGAYGSDISTKVAIRSVTTVSGVEQENTIETIEVVDRDSGLTLMSKMVNAPSSAHIDDYSFEIDFSSYFTGAGKI